jgi:threonine 3-dehydrogenase
VHTALSFDLVGEDVLITGAGPIGYMAAAIAKQVGARYVVVSDVNEYRLQLVRKIPGVYTVNPRQLSFDKVMSELGMNSFQNKFPHIVGDDRQKLLKSYAS